MAGLTYNEQKKPIRDVDFIIDSMKSDIKSLNSRIKHNEERQRFNENIDKHIEYNDEKYKEYCTVMKDWKNDGKSFLSEYNEEKHNIDDKDLFINSGDETKAVKIPRDGGKTQSLFV